MDDVVFVGGRQASTQVLNNLELSVEWHLPFGWQQDLVGDNVRERPARDVFHRDERTTLMFTDVKDRDDVLMAKSSGRHCLTSKALSQLLRIELIGQ